jgi:hypothetical protein
VFFFYYASPVFLKATRFTKDRTYVPFEQIGGNTPRDDFFVGFNGIQKMVSHLCGNLETNVK